MMLDSLVQPRAAVLVLVVISFTAGMVFGSRGTDSKLRGCDVVAVRVDDEAPSG